MRKDAMRLPIQTPAFDDKGRGGCRGLKGLPEGEAVPGNLRKNKAHCAAAAGFVHEVVGCSGVAVAVVFLNSPVGRRATFAVQKTAAAAAFVSRPDRL